MSQNMSELERGMRETGIIRPPPEVVVEPMRVAMARKAAEAEFRRVAAEVARELAEAQAPRAVPAARWVPPVPESDWVQKTVAWTFGLLFFGTLCVGAFVPIERMQNTQVELDRQKIAKTVLVCADGYSVAANIKSVWTWVTGGSTLVCTNWETPEGRDGRAFTKSEAAAKRARE